MFILMHKVLSLSTKTYLVRFRTKASWNFIVTLCPCSHCSSKTDVFPNRIVSGLMNNNLISWSVNFFSKTDPNLIQRWFRSDSHPVFTYVIGHQWARCVTAPRQTSTDFTKTATHNNVVKHGNLGCCTRRTWQWRSSEPGLETARCYRSLLFHCFFFF